MVNCIFSLILYLVKKTVFMLIILTAIMIIHSHNHKIYIALLNDTYLLFQRDFVYLYLMRITSVQCSSIGNIDHSLHTHHSYSVQSLPSVMELYTAAIELVIVEES